ncbi:hypothetical protein MBLNU459_g4898t1 [Dothideomycetes sp. NU459]
MAFGTKLYIPLRVAQAIFTIIVLGLCGDVANWWGSFWHAYSPSEINFLLFTSVWTILALLYLILAPWLFPQAAHKFGILAAEALTMLFWFAGFIALAAFLSVRACWGSVCTAAKVATVFAAFQWLLFAISTLLATLHVLRTRGTHNNKADPAMDVHQGT